MEENVNFDNEVLAYLTIRKVWKLLRMVLTLMIGLTDWKPQAVHPGAPRDQRSPQRLLVSRPPPQASKFRPPVTVS